MARPALEVAPSVRVEHPSLEDIPVIEEEEPVDLNHINHLGLRRFLRRYKRRSLTLPRNLVHPLDPTIIPKAGNKKLGVPMPIPPSPLFCLETVGPFDRNYILEKNREAHIYITQVKRYTQTLGIAVKNLDTLVHRATVETPPSKENIRLMATVLTLSKRLCMVYYRTKALEWGVRKLHTMSTHTSNALMHRREFQEPASVSARNCHATQSQRVALEFWIHRMQEIDRDLRSQIVTMPKNLISHVSFQPYNP